MSNRLLLPICLAIGHVEVPSEDKPGWFKNECGRCGRLHFKPYFWQVWRARIPYIFLWVANKTSVNSPTYKPQFRAIDQHIDGIGGKHSCGAYSYEHIISFIDQYKNDGLPEPLLKDLISEDGWIEIGDDNADEIVSMINEDFERESNRQEREKTMKLMHGSTTQEREKD